MTMLPPGFDFGPVWAQLDDKERERALSDAAEELGEIFNIAFEELMRVVSLTKAPPADRLARYRARPPEVWAIYAQLWPKGYEDDQQDWNRLEEREREKAQPQPERTGPRLRGPGPAYVGGA